MAKMTIHNTMNTSRSSRCQPYAKSATDRNFRAKANSKNPKTTLTALSQPPDLGMAFSHDGNRAKMLNGKAKAKANPNIPIVGASIEFFVETSTSKVPMMGPVHEKETTTKVNAMSKMLKIPDV